MSRYLSITNFYNTLYAFLKSLKKFSFFVVSVLTSTKRVIEKSGSSLYKYPPFFSHIILRGSKYYVSIVRSGFRSSASCATKITSSMQYTSNSI